MEARVLSPCGVIGSGFPQSSFERGLSMKPHIIACDGGSTDNGPAFLGAGNTELLPLGDQTRPEAHAQRDAKAWEFP